MEWDMLAMGVDPAVALGAVRLSLGNSSTDADITAAAGELVRAAASYRQATGE